MRVMDVTVGAVFESGSKSYVVFPVPMPISKSSTNSVISVLDGPPARKRRVPPLAGRRTPRFAHVGFAKTLASAQGLDCGQAFENGLLGPEPLPQTSVPGAKISHCCHPLGVTVPAGWNTIRPWYVASGMTVFSERSLSTSNWRTGASGPVVHVLNFSLVMSARRTPP